jgi:hypothetical protein
VSINALIVRVSALIAAQSEQAGTYKDAIEKLNHNAAMVTPSSPAKCTPAM